MYSNPSSASWRIVPFKKREHWKSARNCAFDLMCIRLQYFNSHDSDCTDIRTGMIFPFDKGKYPKGEGLDFHIANPTPPLTPLRKGDIGEVKELRF